MKIISLNTFAGTVFEDLLAFIENQKIDTDIFCLQEIFTTKKPGFITTPIGKRANLLQELVARLPDYQMFYSAAQEGLEGSEDVVPGVTEGLAIFVKKTHVVNESGEFFICNSFNSFVPPDFLTFPYNLLFVGLTIGGRPLTVCCLHGASQPGHKLDSPERLAQSQKVIDFLKDRPGEKIVMGDFNLLPQAKSVGMFSEAGYRDLIADFKITTTRGTKHKELNPQYANTKEGFQEYADYTFVTPGLKVTSFEVPDVPISDHLPMILEVE